MNENEGLSIEEKRQLRRQRRVKNLVCAYIGLMAALVILGVAIFFGIRALNGILGEKESTEPAAAEQEEIPVEE